MPQQRKVARLPALATIRRLTRPAGEGYASRGRLSLHCEDYAHVIKRGNLNDPLRVLIAAEEESERDKSVAEREWQRMKRANKLVERVNQMLGLLSPALRPVVSAWLDNVTAARDGNKPKTWADIAASLGLNENTCRSRWRLAREALTKHLPAFSDLLESETACEAYDPYAAALDEAYEQRLQNADNNRFAADRIESNEDWADAHGGYDPPQSNIRASIDSVSAYHDVSHRDTTVTGLKFSAARGRHGDAVRESRFSAETVASDDERAAERRGFEKSEATRTKAERPLTKRQRAMLIAATTPSPCVAPCQHCEAKSREKREVAAYDERLAQRAAARRKPRRGKKPQPPDPKRAPRFVADTPLVHGGERGPPPVANPRRGFTDLFVFKNGKARSR